MPNTTSSIHLVCAAAAVVEYVRCPTTHRAVPRTSPAPRDTATPAAPAQYRLHAN